MFTANCITNRDTSYPIKVTNYKSGYVFTYLLEFRSATMKIKALNLAVYGFCLSTNNAILKDFTSLILVFGSPLCYL